jgi:hypothetical protein
LEHKMFEDIPGRLLSGALWGLAAGVALRVLNLDGRESNESRDSNGQAPQPRSSPVRPVMKTLIKGYVAVADGVSRLTAEARETVGDLYAEAQAERQRPSNGVPPPDVE